MDDRRECGCCGGIAALYRDILAQGWQYRTSGEPFRIEEQRELYEALGFEVLVLPLRGPRPHGPESCADIGSGRDLVLFTRGRPREVPETPREGGSP